MHLANKSEALAALDRQPTAQCKECARSGASSACRHTFAAPIFTRDYAAKKCDMYTTAHAELSPAAKPPRMHSHLCSQRCWARKSVQQRRCAALTGSCACHAVAGPQVTRALFVHTVGGLR
eukprot:364297-Chlamydomonas_euryale.AAC.12